VEAVLLLRTGARGGTEKENRMSQVDDSKSTSGGDHEAFDWRAEYAYALGLQAFIYGFPYIYMAQVRHGWVTQPRNPEFIPYSAVNHFWNASNVLTAEYQDGGSPNNDTMYSIAWVDVSDEPVILSHPDIPDDRYFTFEHSAVHSDNFAYVGRRVTGNKAGNYAIIGPGWEGQLPDGVTALPQSPTPWVLVLGRTLVDGPDDAPNVQKLQEEYRLTSLSLWGTESEVPEHRDVLVPFDQEKDPLAPWKTLNAMLAENPPPAKHEQLMKQFATIGVGPGLDVEEQDEVTKENLMRAAAVGKQLLNANFTSGWSTITLNGWRYPSPHEGRAGDDFLLRAVWQSLAGIVANDPEEAVYLLALADGDGEPLTGANGYEVRFAPGQEPPVDAFWSLTMYSTNYNLVPNPIDRYSLGDRTKGLKRDSDGGLTFYVQHESPGEDEESNWLPAPDGPFFVILRMYQPHQEVIDAKWAAPPAQKVG
jgi:hypothetical protein